MCASLASLKVELLGHLLRALLRLHRLALCVARVLEALLALLEDLFELGLLLCGVEVVMELQGGERWRGSLREVLMDLLGVGGALGEVAFKVMSSDLDGVERLVDALA